MTLSQPGDVGLIPTQAHPFFFFLKENIKEIKEIVNF